MPTLRSYPPRVTVSFITTSAALRPNNPSGHPSVLSRLLGGWGSEMTFLRMQPVSVAAQQLIDSGGAGERNFLKVTAQAPAPLPVVRSESPITSAAPATPWAPPSAVNKAYADFGPALSTDAVSELLGTPTGAGPALPTTPSRTMQRLRQDELNRISNRVDLALGSWEDAIRPPEEWEASDGDAEEIQGTIDRLLVGQRQRGHERRNMLLPVADATHQAKQLKQLERIEREYREEEEEVGGTESVAEAVAAIRACKERLGALHVKEKELLVEMRASVDTLGAELDELRGGGEVAVARQREAEEALEDAHALAASLQACV